MEIAALLKKHHPDLYAELSKQTKAERKTRLNRNLRMPGGFSFPKNANNAV